MHITTLATSLTVTHDKDIDRTMRTLLHHKTNPADRPQSEKFYRFLHKKKEESYAHTRRAKVEEPSLSKTLDIKTVTTDSETIVSGEYDDPTISAGSIDVMEKELDDSLCEMDLNLVHFISDEGHEVGGGVVGSDISLHQGCDDRKTRKSDKVAKMTIHQARLKVAKGDPEIVIVDCAYGLGYNECNPDGSNTSNTYRTSTSSMMKATMNERETFLRHAQNVRNGKSKYANVRNDATSTLQANFKTAKDDVEIQAAKLAERKIKRIAASYYNDHSNQQKRFQNKFQRNSESLKGPENKTDSPSESSAAKRRQEEVKEILLMRLAKLRGTGHPKKSEMNAVAEETDGLEKFIIGPNETDQTDGVSSLSNGVLSLSNQTDGVSALSSASYFEKYEDLMNENTGVKRDECVAEDDNGESKCMSGSIWDTSLLQLLGQHLFDNDEEENEGENENKEEESVAHPPTIVTVRKKGHLIIAGRKE